MPFILSWFPAFFLLVVRFLLGSHAADLGLLSAIVAKGPLALIFLRHVLGSSSLPDSPRVHAQGFDGEDELAANLQSCDLL